MKAEEIIPGQSYWVLVDSRAIRVMVREIHQTAFQFWLCVDDSGAPHACALGDFIQLAK